MFLEDRLPAAAPTRSAAGSTAHDVIVVDEEGGLHRLLIHRFWEKHNEQAAGLVELRPPTVLVTE